MANDRKILHIYSGNLFGGVERMLISLAELDSSQSFALCFEGKLSQALRAAGSHVTSLSQVRLRNPLSALRARRKLAQLLRSERFDAVICHSIWAYCIFASVVARAKHLPILFVHDIPDPKHAYYRWAWRRPPALCIANSRTTAAPLAQLRPPVTIRLVHPLVLPPRPGDASAVHDLRTLWGAKAADVVVLLASRFESLKGHRNLLHALATMKAVPQWRCWIAGSPQRPEEEIYKAELVRLIDTLGIGDRVAFIGHRDDMETVLASCDVYCQPNEIPEAFGMVFVEALYAGRPVVGRALGGATEIVTPDCGLLCGEGVEALSTALRPLLCSAELRAQMSDAGPTHARALCGPEAFDTQFRAALNDV